MWYSLKQTEADIAENLAGTCNEDMGLGLEKQRKGGHIVNDDKCLRFYDYYSMVWETDLLLIGDYNFRD
jgi:hypothetical protein